VFQKTERFGSNAVENIVSCRKISCQTHDKSVSVSSQKVSESSESSGSDAAAKFSKFSPTKLCLNMKVISTLEDAVLCSLS
jgi:hypothetical protein